jgi:spoIIIJ-associated protein
MEWVETTGKTVEEAKDLALDQLGVDHQDAEFEVVEEPKTGLFGRVRGEARVRARIAPKSPRPKNDRRRGGRSKGKGEGEGRSNQRDGQRSNGRSDQRDGENAGGSQGSRPKSQSDSPKRESQPREERPPMDADEQCKVASEFLSGLVTSFGLTGEVTANLDEDDFLNVGVQGEGLGLLIGPGLNTLDALQELTRNAVQRQADGREYGRVVVDVDGVRARRRAALEQFVADAAKKVVETGDTVVFEVMSSADRKVVHDTVGDLDGVVSGSEGEDPRRRVVLKPA